MVCALFTVALCAGCSDFLEQDNKGNVGQSDYYTTDAGFKSLSSASYSLLRTLYGGDPWLVEGGTDLFTSGRNPVANVAKYVIDISDGNIKSFYVDHYKAISLANDVIYWGGDNPTRARLVAEAKGLRAFYYFTLVQHFGGVPLILDRQAGMMTSAERKSSKDIYEFVIGELTELIGTGSALLERATGEDFNHFDKRAAVHFLAKAYLFRGYETDNPDDFEQAKKLADQAIGGFRLETSFSDLMSIEGENNAEVIFP
ncbi:MAG: RagB/SusD family nutrient uptake outer membrane protein [Bacteroides sp.]|nr:RagB/SusD family nutrient uptake outer membrane protein [Bacteroides sp.]